MDEGDLVRFKERYTPPYNPPMLLVGRKYEGNRHYVLALDFVQGEHWIDLKHAWWYEVVNEAG